MSEALRLSLLLELKDNASGGVRAFVSDLKLLDKQGNLTLKTLERIRKEFNKKLKFGGVTGTDQSLRDIKKLENEVDKLRSKLGKKISFGGVTGTGKSLSDLKKLEEQSSQTVSGLNKVKTRLNAKTRSERRPASEDDVPLPPRVPYQDPRRRRRDPIAEPYSFVERMGHKYDTYVEPTQQISSAIRQGFRDANDLTRPYTDAAKKLGRAQAQFMIMDRGGEENAKAFQVVADSIKKDRNTTRAEGMGLMTDLVNTVGSVAKASQVYGIASKYAFGAQALYGHSDEQTQEAVQKAFKAIELTGATSVPNMTRMFDVMTKISAATGGRITGDDFLNFTRKGGSSARDLNEKGLNHLATLFEEMGSHQVGTALTTASQAILGGRMPQAKLRRWSELGMLDTSKVEFNKTTGVVKSMQPGAIYGSEVFQSDPLAFADKIRDALVAKGGLKLEYDAEGNLTEQSSQQVTKELKGLFGDRTAERLFNSLITQRGSVLRETASQERAMGIEKSYAVAQQSDVGKALMFEKSWQRFKEDAGGPVLQSMTSLMATAQPLLALMGQYPDATSKMILGLGGLKIAASVSESFSILSRVMDGSRLSMLATGGQAVTTGAQVGGLRGKLAGLPSLVKIGISLAAVGFTWEMIQWLRETAAKQTEQRMGSASANKQATDIRDIQKAEAAKFTSPEHQRQHYRSLGMSEATINDAMPNARRDASELNRSLTQGRNNALVKQIDPSRKGLADILPDLGRVLTLQRTEWQTLGPMPTDIAAKRAERQQFYDKQGSRNENRWTDYAAAAIFPALIPTLRMRVTDSQALTERELQGAAYFREQAPQLRDPEVMRAFRTQEIPKMGLDQQGQADLNNMLKLAFPESFTASANASAESLTTFSAALTSINDPAIQTGGVFMALAPAVQPLPQQFTDLGGPITDTRSGVTDLGNAIQPVPGQLGNLNTSVSNVSGSLNSLSASIASWRPPASPAAVPGGVSFGPTGFVNPVAPPGYAVGGDLTQSGLAIVHAREQIVPAKAVSFRDRLSQSMISTTSDLRQMVERYSVADGGLNRTPVGEQTRLQGDVFSGRSRVSSQTGEQTVANYLPSGFRQTAADRPDTGVNGRGVGIRGERETAMLQRPQAGSRAINVTYSPQVTINASNSDGQPQDIGRQIEEALEAHYERTFPRIVRDLTREYDHGRRWS